MWQEKGTQKHQTRLAQYYERKGVVVQCTEDQKPGLCTKAVTRV